jgi:predicted ATP-grasp superfamily ATP-dependent carboligase
MRTQCCFPTVLLIGSCLTLAAKVARCLQLAGLTPLVLGTDQVRPLAWLPECKAFTHWNKVKWIGGALNDGIEQLNEVCQRHAVDIVVPSDYATTLYLAEQRSQITDAATGLLPDPRLMQELHNKWLLTRRMDRLGIRYPKSALAQDERQLMDHGLSYPILTKPLEGWYGVGIRTYSNPDDLEEASRKGLRENWPVLVQEFISGTDVDMSFIAVKGKLLAHSIFRHEPHSRRFLEAPELERAVKSILQDANYTGVGHVDTRHRSDGYHILELNPRFWASLLFERRAGLNYPELFVRVGLSAPDFTSTRASPGLIRLSLREMVVGRTLTWVQKAHEFVEHRRKSRTRPLKPAFPK